MSKASGLKLERGRANKVMKLLKANNETPERFFWIARRPASAAPASSVELPDKWPLRKTEHASSLAIKVPCISSPIEVPRMRGSAIGCFPERGRLQRQSTTPEAAQLRWIILGNDSRDQLYISLTRALIQTLLNKACPRRFSG